MSEVTYKPQIIDGYNAGFWASRDGVKAWGATRRLALKHLEDRIMRQTVNRALEESEKRHARR